MKLLLSPVLVLLLASTAYAETPSLKACVLSCDIWNDQTTESLDACLTECKERYESLGLEDISEWYKNLEEDFTSN